MTSYSTRYYDPPVRFRDVITRADIDALVQGGQTSLILGPQSSITDEAREQALKLGVAIQSAEQKPKAAAPVAPPVSAVPPAPVPPRPVAPVSASAPSTRPGQFPVSPGYPARAQPASATPATIIEAVVAELHARRVTPSVSLIQEIVTSVNAALASARP